MSEESDFSDDSPMGWIQWFCSLDDHQFFCEVNDEYIRQPINLHGLNKRVKNFNKCLDMILKTKSPREDQIEDPLFLEVYQEATELYGLIHARYITSPEGMAIMREKYLSGKFGTCPRVLCEKQNVIPIGISEDCKIARVKVYCPRCKDIYSPKKKFADVDGCFFGTSFPHLLLMTYTDIGPIFAREEFTPTIFGFKIEEKPEKAKKKIMDEPQESTITQDSQLNPDKKKKKKKN